MYDRDDVISCDDVTRENNDSSSREIKNTKPELKENEDECLNADDKVQTLQQEEHYNGNTFENKEEYREICKMESENIGNKSADSVIHSENKEKMSADLLDN